MQTANQTTSSTLVIYPTATDAAPRPIAVMRKPEALDTLIHLVSGITGPFNFSPDDWKQNRVSCFIIPRDGMGALLDISGAKITKPIKVDLLSLLNSIEVNRANGVRRVVEPRWMMFSVGGCMAFGDVKARKGYEFKLTRSDKPHGLTLGASYRVLSHEESGITADIYLEEISGRVVVDLEDEDNGFVSFSNLEELKAKVGDRFIYDDDTGAPLSSTTAPALSAPATVQPPAPALASTDSERIFTVSGTMLTGEGASALDALVKERLAIAASIGARVTTDEIIAAIVKREREAVRVA